MRRIVLLFALVPCGFAAPAASPHIKASDLFVTTKVWDAHLTISQDEWKAMQPREVDLQAERRAHPGKATRNGYLASQGIDFPWGHAGFDFGGVTFHDVGVRFKGNGTFLNARDGNERGRVSGTEKVPYKVHLNEFVKGQKLGKISTLDFRNNITDSSWMNEALGYRLYRDAGVPAPRTSYVRLFLTIEGKFTNRYLGLYSLSEEVEKEFLEEHFSNAAGTLLKPYNRDSWALFEYRGSEWNDYVQELDPKDTPVAADKKRLMEFCYLFTKASDAELARRLGEFVDLDEMARFMAVTVWLSDGDSLMDNGQNFYTYLDPRTNKLVFIPWDLDHTFGQFPQHLNQRQREERPIFPRWYKRNPFLERIFTVPAFRQLYVAHLTEFSRTLLDPKRLAGQVDELAPYIRTAVAEQGRAARTDILDRFDRAVAGKTNSLQEFGSGDIVPIKPFAVRRSEFVNAQLRRIR